MGGFNVITLPDCMAATSVIAHHEAVTPFRMFSTPMTAETFSEALVKKAPPDSEPGVSDVHVRNGKGFARTHVPGLAGMAPIPSTTAILCIEYQKEFTTEGGKLHPAVQECMEETNMLENTIATVNAARDKGVLIYHMALTFA